MKLGHNLLVMYCVLKRHCHLVINSLLIDLLPISSGPRRGLALNFARSDRFGNSDRPSNSDRSGNWRQKSIISSSPASLEPLSDSDRKFLMKYKDYFRCRKTFIDHT